MELFKQFREKRKSDEKTREVIDSFDNFMWEDFLKCEAKFRSQQKTVKRSSKDNPITLGYILKELLNIDLSDTGSMTIVSRSKGEDDKTEVIKEQSRILEYKPYEAILYTNPEGETLFKMAQNTTLVISYRPNSIVFSNQESKQDKSRMNFDNSIIMFLRGLGSLGGGGLPICACP